MRELSYEIGGTILFIIAALLLIRVIAFIVDKTYWAQIHKHHPGYDREFSKAESEYVSKSQNELSIFSQSLNLRQKGFSIFYIAGPFVGLMLVWSLMWWGSNVLVMLANEFGLSQIADGTAGYYISVDIGFSTLIALLSGITLASWALYLISAYWGWFWEWMALTRGAMDTWETAESILNRRLIQIEYDVRISRLDKLEKFSPRNYLRAIVKRHTKYTGIAALSLLGFTLAFLYLDLRDRTIFYKDHVIVNNYWSGQKTISYSDLTEVRSGCNIYEGNISMSLDFIVGGNSVEYISLAGNDLLKDTDSLDLVDDALRSYAVPFVRQTLENGSSAFPPNCLSDLKNKFNPSEVKRIRKIFHADELLTD